MKMLRERFELRRKKPQVFQAVFLKNDKNQNVEVLENEQIDFGIVKEHLKRGGSVFITSKNSQKLKLEIPKNLRKNISKQKQNRNNNCRYFGRL